MTDLHSLTGAYAVDALDAEEKRAFQAHLRDCPECTAEVRELVATASLLGHLTPTAPPPALRSAVLAEISQVRPLPPMPPAAGAPTRRVRTWMAAAAAVVVLGVGVSVAGPWREEPAPTRTDRVLAADDTTTTRAVLSNGAHATVRRSRGLGLAVLSVSDLPPAPQGRVYQVWWQDPQGALTSAGMMPSHSEAPMLLEGNASTMAGVGITVEPAGGSVQPTSSPLGMMALE